MLKGRFPKLFLSTIVCLSIVAFSPFVFAQKLEESTIEATVQACVRSRYPSSGTAQAVAIAEQEGYAVVAWVTEGVGGLAFLSSSQGGFKCEYAEDGFPHPTSLQGVVNIPLRIILDLYDKIYPNWNMEIFGD